MGRIRLNQESRNKVKLKMKSYAEQEDTQEKEKFFQERENFKAIQDKTWELAQQCVTRQYPKEDVDMAHYLQDKYPNVNTIAKDSCFHFGYKSENKADEDYNEDHETWHKQNHFAYNLHDHLYFHLIGNQNVS